MVALIISGINKSVGQSNETIFSFDYSLAPIGSDEIDFYKADFKASIPIKLKKGLLINNFGVDFHELNYGKDYSFSTTNLSKFNDLSYGLKYIYPFADTWKINTLAEASLVSNSTSNIKGDDLFFGGEISVTKQFGADDISGTLTFGASYNTITGKPRFLPTIIYSKQVSNKLSYGIGFPKTYIEYKINDLSTLTSMLSTDGVYSNLSTPILVSTIRANKASFTTTSLTIEYHYKMDDNWAILFKGGYLLSNKYTLLNSENNKVFDFNTTPKPIFSAGLKFNIKK